MKIAFHTNQLSERGCELALFDYCRNTMSLLGHEPIVFYRANDNLNVRQVIDKFSQQFEVVGYQEFSQVDEYISSMEIDLFYAIKGGELDNIYSRKVPSMIHAVFAQSPFEIHGSAYAFISEWLSAKCSASLVPSVPFIVNPPIDPDRHELRAHLGIPSSATVFACYGGSSSFDISFVRDIVLPEVLNARSDIHFLFMNFPVFIAHPRVHFLPRSTERSRKEAFVAASDAMIHARRQGESFGLACAEFSAQSKPIFAFKYAADRHPQFILGDAITLYSDSKELINQLLTFDATVEPHHDVDIYLRRYTAEKVMELFDRHLICPAVKAGGFGVQTAIFTHSLRKPISPFLRSFLWHIQILFRRANRLAHLFLRRMLLS